MAEIDIGHVAEDQASFFNPGLGTLFFTENPANATGYITEVKVFGKVAGTTLRVGIFGPGFTHSHRCRSSVSLGNFVEGLNTYAVSLVVVAGDYIGCYYTDGAIEASGNIAPGENGVAEGEHIDSGDEADYILNGQKTGSLYGTGVIADLSPTVTTQAVTMELDMVTRSYL